MDILCSNFLSSQFVIFITLEDLFNLDAALKNSFMKDIIIGNLNKKNWLNWYLYLPFKIMPNLVQIYWVIKKKLNITSITIFGDEIKDNLQKILPRIHWWYDNCIGWIKLTLSNCKCKNKSKHISRDTHQYLRRILRYNKSLNYIIDLNSTELNDMDCKNLKIFHMIDELIQNEENKEINEDRIKSHEYQMNLESSQMDFEWLIKLAGEIQGKVVIEQEEITIELEEEISSIIMLELLMEMDFAVGTIAKQCPGLENFDCLGTSWAYKEDVYQLLIIQRCFLPEAKVFQDNKYSEFDMGVNNDPLIQFIQEFSYDDLKYNDYRCTKQNFGLQLNDKLKSWIYFEKHKIDYNLLLYLKKEWELELDLLHFKWILTQDKLEVILMESRRQLERKKQINSI